MKNALKRPLGHLRRNALRGKIKALPFQRQVNGRLKYASILCDYVYGPKEGDPDNGIAPGTVFKDLPDECL